MCKNHVNIVSLSQIVDVCWLRSIVPSLNNWDRLDMSHLQQINEGDMLTSTIMNVFIQLFAKKSPSFGFISSHVMTIRNLSKISKDHDLLIAQLSRYALDDLENTTCINNQTSKVFMPLFGDVHWMLAVWYKSERKIEVWDSLASKQRVNKWKQPLVRFCQQFVPGEYDYVFANPNSCMQSDGTNCGVFVLYFVWKIVNGSSTADILADNTICSQRMNDWRKPLCALAAYIHLLQQVCIPSPKKLFGDKRDAFQNARKNAIAVQLSKQ